MNFCHADDGINGNNGHGEEDVLYLLPRQVASLDEYYLHMGTTSPNRSLAAINEFQEEEAVRESIASAERDPTRNHSAQMQQVVALLKDEQRSQRLQMDRIKGSPLTNDMAAILHFARDYYTREYTMHQTGPLDDPQRELAARNNLAWIYRLQGMYFEALNLLQESSFPIGHSIVQGSHVQYVGDVKPHEPAKCRLISPEYLPRTESLLGRWARRAFRFLRSSCGK